MVEIDDNNLDQDSKDNQFDIFLLLFIFYEYYTGWVLYGDAPVKVLADEVPVVE